MHTKKSEINYYKVFQILLKIYVHNFCSEMRFCVILLTYNWKQVKIEIRHMYLIVGA